MTKAVWEKASQVMNLFEEGETKEQVLTVKALKAKPAFKAHYLAPLHTMPEETQVRQETVCMYDTNHTKVNILQIRNGHTCTLYTNM